MLPKPKFILLATSLLFFQTLLAQDSTRIVIAAGQRFSEVITPAIMYRYKEFRPGRVLFNTGAILQATLNYNLFNGEIVFISPTGDTLAIAKKQVLDVKRISIDTNAYVYNKAFLEIIRENKIGALARKQQYYMVSREKIGAYNMASSTSSIDSYSSLIDRFDNRHDLVVRENVYLQLKTEYYVGDTYNRFLPLNRKNLEKIFFKQRDQLQSYLRDHSIDFQNRQQVIDLFVYLTETQP